MLLKNHLAYVYINGCINNNLINIQVFYDVQRENET